MDRTGIAHERTTDIAHERTTDIAHERTKVSLRRSFSMTGRSRS